MKICQLVAALVLTIVLSQGGNAVDNQFATTADNTVLIDRETGLMWPMQDNGTDISWPAAKDYCENVSLGGYQDWRMPTREELATLYNLEAANSSEYYIHQQVRITAGSQWAIDTSDQRVGRYDFEYANKDWGYPMSSVDARVLPVRNNINK